MVGAHGMRQIELDDGRAGASGPVGEPQVGGLPPRHLGRDGTVGVLSGLKWRSSDEVAQALAQLFRFVAQGLGDRLVVRLAR